MICRVHTGIPGSGKTLAQLSRVVEAPGCHLIAVPRVDLVDEFDAQIRTLVGGHRPGLSVVPIHSRQNGERAGVRRRLDDALIRPTSGDAHIVVLATHEALFGIDPARLDGVHIAIDEVPDCAVLSGQFIGLTASYALERLYDLAPIGESSPWNSVSARPGVELVAPSARAVEAKDLAAFLKAASNPTRVTLVDIAAWDDARTPRRYVRWWSVWTPMTLRQAASVSIAGAGFQRSLLFHACRAIHGDDLIFEPEKHATTITRAQPEVMIAYFAGHRGSTEWWASDAGSRCLVQISRYLEGVRFQGYWGCNEVIRPYFLHRIGGEACPPRMSGTNSLRQHQECCMIYSNKARAEDTAVLDALGLDREAITQAREHEDLVQFVMRGAIRDPSFGGRYLIYVYSVDQAEALRDELVENGITDRVEVRAIVEAGILDVRRPTGARGATAEPTPTRPTKPAILREQQLERDRLCARERRAALRAQRKVEGTYRPPGRPVTEAFGSD